MKAYFGSGPRRTVRACCLFFAWWFPFSSLLLVVCHTVYPRGSLMVSHHMTPRNFVLSPLCPGKAPTQCVVKVMFNPGAPSQIPAPGHSLSANCAHGNYTVTCLVGNLHPQLGGGRVLCFWCLKVIQFWH